MSVIQGNAFSDDEVDTGDIGHSLRFRSGASANLTRTIGTPTSQNVWTWSGWVKRGLLSTNVSIFGGEAGVNSGTLQFNATNQLYYVGLQEGVGGAYGNCQSVALFRDPTSFIHVVINFDGGRSASDRIRMYASGIQLSTTNPIALTATQYVNASGAIQSHGIRQYNGPAEYFDGYIARSCFVDGTALTPSSFGYLNTTINEWVTKGQSAVKAVVDAGGTNSFMLDFDDATSLTTLGYDKSSKGNNWTLNNFSLTAGTTYDHMLDVPGNSYAVMSPIDQTLTSETEGNLKVTTNVGGYQGACRATLAFPSTGKWYWETVIASLGGSAGQAPMSGIMSTATGIAISAWTSYGYYGANGNRQQYTNGSLVTNAAYGATFTTGDVIGYAFDADAGTFTFYKNGVSQGQAFSGISGTYMPVIWDPATGGSTNINFGQAPLHTSATYDSASGGYFRYAPPTGFKALCQANLPTPAILNPSSAVAHRFEAGSGIAAAIASDRSGWSDWMEWFKRTDTTESWKVRFSDDSGNMMAFDTNGAKAAWSAPSTGTYLGTAFKVGATYGVVTGTYSGDSTSNKNISHSLGKAPTCGIVKNESTGTWYVWHTKMTSAAYFTTLNSATPPAQSNTNTPWGTGNWSSTQFMVTNNATNNLNATGSTYRYILFADIDGLLALLGHTGNASTDGAFEYAGHKAQLLIEKDLSATTGFYLWSDKINTYNVTASYLLLNTNAGTAAATGVDVCSNGTKYRSATIANAANPHMGISYSRTSGKYSLGR